MRTFIYGLLIGLLLYAGGVMLWMKTHEKKEKPQEPVIQIVEKNQKIDSLQFCINDLTKQIDSSKTVIKQKNGKIQTQKAELSVYKAYKDSLQMAYDREKTFARCDSLVQAQSIVILSQDSILEELDQEAQEYSKQVYLLGAKTELQEIIIQQQDSTIKDLNCAARWKVENRFWAWLMGWKCQKK
jgi:hypothetical protein